MCQRTYRTLDRTFLRATFHQWTGNPLSLSSIELLNGYFISKEFLFPMHGRKERFVFSGTGSPGMEYINSKNRSVYP